MANLAKKIKKKNRFGTPPSEKEAGDNLSAPENAPYPLIEKEKKKTRPARRTGRTEAFGTRVSPEFLKDFKRIAFEDDLKFVELLEKSLESYKQSRS